MSKKAEIKAQVEKRAAAEKASRKNSGSAQPAQQFSDDDIRGYLAENRLGDAKLYTRLMRGKVVFVKPWNRFLVWTGHHWSEDDYDDAGRYIEEVCKLYLDFAERLQKSADVEPAKEKKASLAQEAESVLRRVNQLRDVPGQNKLLEMLPRVENPLTILPEVIDQQHFLKACPNGVIDLRNGQLIDGKPEQYLLNAIATPYRPELLDDPDPCPQTSRYLLSSMDGDQEIVDFIWRLLGYAMITKRADHIFVIFWGEHGRNGKDTLIKLVTRVLGEKLSGDVPVEMFLQTSQPRSSSTPSPDVLALRGMCIAWINEAEDGNKFAMAKLKKLSGGGRITARGLHDKNQTTWEQTHLPIMTTNELPRAKAEDAAFWQRAKIVKWPLSFVDEPEQPYERLADKQLEQKVLEEAEGVLVRMVRGAMEYVQNGLRIPEKVSGWTKEQRDEEDDVGVFLENWCIREPYKSDPSLYATRIKATELHEAYCLWYAQNCDSRAKARISAKKFGIILNHKHIPIIRSDGTWRAGLTLTSDAYAELDRASQREGDL